MDLWWQRWCWAFILFTSSASSGRLGVVQTHEHQKQMDCAPPPPLPSPSYDTQESAQMLVTLASGDGGNGQRRGAQDRGPQLSAPVEQNCVGAWQGRLDSMPEGGTAWTIRTMYCECLPEWFWRVTAILILWPRYKAIQPTMSGNFECWCICCRCSVIFWGCG